MRMQGIKLFMDGSNQGFTGRLQWPGYYNDAPDGIWTLPHEREKLKDVLLPYHEAGLTIYCHTNGDQASRAFIDAVELLQTESPRPATRHTMEHVQMMTDDQYRRAKELDLAVNTFTNHIFYYGDQHYTKIMGPSRAKSQNAPGMAEDAEVPYTLHSDAPVTPMGQLHTAWAAVNRKTASGRVLGKAERISVDKALKAVTIGAAYQLNMDDEIGSIESGKWADFTVLEKDPYAVDPMDLKDIPIWGTVVGGEKYKASN